MSAMAFVAQALRISVPYLLAALGGTLSERSGVINIALEGLMLFGAFAGALACVATGSALVGLGFGVAMGVALAAVYALTVVRLRGDQIVCGVAITLLASGLTRVLLRRAFHSTANSPRIPAFSSSWPLVVATAVLVVVVHFVLQRTRFGLRLRAAGEHPEALLSLGVSVEKLRWAGVLASGALAGLAGVWLAFDQHEFVAGMSAGRGFVALAAMILGGWRPLGALAGCLLFGTAEAAQVVMQAHKVGLAPGTVQSIPYVLTIVALAVGRRASSPPRALGRPTAGP